MYMFNFYKVITNSFNRFSLCNISIKYKKEHFIKIKIKNLNLTANSFINKIAERIFVIGCKIQSIHSNSLTYIFDRFISRQLHQYDQKS